MSKSRSDMSNVLNISEITANIIPFLNLNEIPNFARINMSTGAIVHKLNQSKKFKENAVNQTILRMMQEDARIVFENHPATATEAECKLLDATLKKIMEGKVTRGEKLFIESKQLKSSREGVVGGSVESKKKQELQRDALALSNQLFVNTPNIFIEMMDTPQMDPRLALFVAAMSLLVSGISASVGYIWGRIDDCRSHNAYQRLKNRIQHFNEMEVKGDGGDSDDEDVLSPRAQGSVRGP